MSASIELNGSFKVRHWEYEDFTTYTETDPNNRLTVTTYKVDCNDADRGDQIRIYRDLGAGFADGDYVIEGIIKPETSTSFSCYILVPCFANTLGGQWNISELESICFRVGAEYYIYLPYTRGIATDTTHGAIFTPTPGTTYYYRMKREGSIVTAELYSDAARTNLLASGYHVVSIRSWRYFYALTGMEYIDTNGSIYLESSYIRNFGIDTSTDLKTVFHVGQGSANLKNLFNVGQDSADLECSFKLIRTAISLNLRATVLITRPAISSLYSKFELQKSGDLLGTFWVTQIYDFTSSTGIAFYWKGSDVSDGDQMVDFEMWSPTGGWVGKFPDGEAEWRWVFLSWEENLIEVGLNIVHADKSEITQMLWTYYSSGTRGLDGIHIWYSNDVKGVFTVKQPGTNNLKGVLTVRQSSSNNLQSEFRIRRTSSLALQAELIVAGKAYAVLNAEFEIG